MRLSDIVRQIQIVLPKYTDVLSTVVGVDSISSAGGVATVTTSADHGLTTGAPIVFQNVSVRTPIDISWKDGLIYYFETNLSHDLTERWHQTVALDGFDDPDWNNSFTLARVPNRRVFGVTNTLSAPVLSGGEVLLENRIDGVNGYHAATVTGPTTFTLTGDFLPGDYYGGKLSASLRVAGAIDLNRILDQYTKQGIDDVWAFVVPLDRVDVSKDMNAESDALSTMTPSDAFRLRVLDGFSLVLIKNTKQDMAAVAALDLFRHDLLAPILKTVCGARFSTGLSTSGEFKAVLKTHGILQYNRAYLVYAYDFEMPADIKDDDTVLESDTRAFRDLDYIHRVGGDDTTDATVAINLDDEPYAGDAFWLRDIDEN